MGEVKLPFVSIVITTFNEEKRIEKCLKSIVNQTYPKNRLEIVIVDDKSTDNTVAIVKKYTHRIFYSGKRFCEVSRALGIRKAKFGLIFFIDADNILPNNDFLMHAVAPFLEVSDLVGSYPERFSYDPVDPPSNRYCSLFGLNDPFQFYSGAREHLSYAEDKWMLRGEAKDIGDYYLVRFSPGNSLTLGSIGFLGKRDLLIKEINKECFFHSDALNNLIIKGENTFAVVKQTVIHMHCRSAREFIGKLARNFANFLKYRNIRPVSWALRDRRRFYISVLVMSTFIIPLKDSIRGYIKKPDLAWFCHPFFCLTVVILYSYMLLRLNISKNIRRYRLLTPADESS